MGGKLVFFETVAMLLTIIYEVQQYVAVNGHVVRTPQQYVDIDNHPTRIRYLDIPYHVRKFSSEKSTRFLRRYKGCIRDEREANARRTDWNVLEEPAVSDVMPGHPEHRLCDTFLNRALDIGHEKTLCVARACVSCIVECGE